jgi:hypothetical protein
MLGLYLVACTDAARQGGAGGGSVEIGAFNRSRDDQGARRCAWVGTDPITAALRGFELTSSRACASANRGHAGDEVLGEAERQAVLRVGDVLVSVHGLDVRGMVSGG